MERHLPSMTGSQQLGVRDCERYIFIYKLFLGEEGGEDASGPLVKSEHFKLANPPESIRRVLSIAGFDTFIEVLDDLEEAVKSF